MSKKDLGGYLSSPHSHGDSNESQFSLTFPTSSCRNHPSDLVVNNFITSSGGTKSVSTTVVHHHQEPGGDGENTHSNFLYVYFFFSYYLCLTPFRLKKVNPSVMKSRQASKFVIHEYFPQKVICGLANLLTLLRYGVEFRRCAQDVRRENPISFFKLFEACSGVVFKTVILKCFWKNKQRFLDVANFLHNPYILPYNKFKIQSVPVVAILCSFYVVLGFVRMIAGDGFLRPSQLSVSWWGRRLAAEARYSFFLANDSHIDYAPSSSEINSIDVLLAVITGLTFQCRFIAGYFVDVGILLCVLSLWAPVTGFSVSISRQLQTRETWLEANHSSENETLSPTSSSTQPASNHASKVQETINQQETETVMLQYKALKRLTELISQACGSTILPFISEAVFGYAIFFEDVLITRNMIHRIVLICFYFCAVNILVFSADVCRKMQCMKAWLWNEERFSSFPHLKLMLVLHDLSTNAVGISASGIFTVDFYLVGSMISVLITLFIIRLQYQAIET